jgi:hypothetical protein
MVAVVVVVVQNRARGRGRRVLHLDHISISEFFAEFLSKAHGNQNVFVLKQIKQSRCKVLLKIEKPMATR